MSKPFADSVGDYALAGWPCVLPVPVEAKSPPPKGFTGADGADTEVGQLVEWARTHADWSVAVRLPDGVIGIDVDHYDKGTVRKRGGDTLAERQSAWGALPPTWSSTARGEGQPSRILFYRVPAGRYATRLGEAIEIIQRHHRYAVVWPSVHHGAGAEYRWYGPDGAPCAVPKPVELPELPAAWVAGLREGATGAGPPASGEAAGRAFLAALRANAPEGPLCAEMASPMQDAARKLIASSHGTRHDAAAEQAYRIVQLGAVGHPGAGAVLDLLASVWNDLTAGENRAGEFDRMLVTAARKAVTLHGPHPATADPCALMHGLTMPAPAPGAAPGAPETEPIGPARELHPLAVIGAHTFDPRGHLDQTIAGAVLGRTQPLLRYAHDARLWLRRGPEVWDTRADLAEWAVALVAELMPHGDPEAEKGSDARDQAERRKRLMSATPSGAVAKKMRALTAGGSHPSAVELGELDREPWLLWAGGVGWDLRACADGPAMARIDPGTPHLHSAATAPAVCPTPLWDRFTAAVWPDPELRAWALRVLAVTLTGYSDKVLPILVGERDRGKTQVVALLMSVLGTYAHAADPRLLGSEIATAHASILYALMGRRLSFIDEGPREGRIGQERLKQITGGGELTANAMHSNPVTWTPTHTLVLTANDEPTLTDPAVRGRVRLIPCLGEPAEVIAARRAIGNPSGPAWRTEAPGVLAAMMREAALWLAEPDSASTAACPEAYRYRADEIAAEQDPVNTWLDDETEPAAPGERASVLYEAFRAWCQRNGVTAGLVPNRTRWGRELTRRGYPAEKDYLGRIRPLRLRGPGGAPMPTTPAVGVFMPSAAAPAATSPRVSGTENLTSPDQLLTSSGANQSGANSQVNPDISGNLTSLTSSLTYLTHTRTRTRAHGTQTENGVRLVNQSGSPVGDTEASPAATAKTGKREAAALARAAAKREAVAAAAGELIELPAAVDRAGVITPLALADAAATLAAIAARSGQLTVDVENSGYPVGHAEHVLRTIQLGDETLAVVLDATDPAHREVAEHALAAASRLHAHSATADLCPLVAAGVTDTDAWLRMHDTVIPAKLGDPTSTGSDPGLKQLAGTVLGDAATAPAADKARAALFKAAGWLTDTEVTTPVERSGWAQVDARCATMVRYAASDVLDTAALAVRLPAIPAAILERERAVQRITARVTHRGLRLDGDHVRAKLAEHTAAMTAAAARVNALGVGNPGSDKEVGTQLIALGAHLPTTPTGRPSVAAAALEALRGMPGHAGALVAAVLDYRHHETVCSTFLEPYRRLVEHGDGRARPTIYTLGTDTGRMSCVRPNLQQLPREGGVRACITADPGYTLISADFAGVELRVAAALSGDANLAGIIARGEDLHWMIAREVYGPEATKGDRYRVKRGVFGRLYGGAVPTLAQQMGVSHGIAQRAVDVLDSITPGLSAWSGAIRRAVKRGATQFPSYSGRVIWLPAEFPHKAPNYGIQGTARELLVDGLIRWDQTEWGGGVLVPVHDEILAMVPEADAERATAALVAAMASNLAGIEIRAEASAPSVSWRDAV